MSTKLSASEITSVLRKYRFNYTSESELHAGIEKALEVNKIPFEHEYPLGKRDRIDFLCGPVGIEVKIEGSPSAVARQIVAYLKYDLVKEIILVTGRVLAAQYLRDGSLSGKPIVIVDLWGTRL